MEVVKYKRLSSLAKTPLRATSGSAGFDLFTAESGTVPKRSNRLFKTDISIELPNNVYGRIAARSGLAIRRQIDVGAGVIDSDFRGNIGIILFNHSDCDFDVKTGDKIAQLIIERICIPEMIEVKDLDETKRGDRGFGSTDN